MSTLTAFLLFYGIPLIIGFILVLQMAEWELSEEVFLLPPLILLIPLFIVHMLLISFWPSDTQSVWETHDIIALHDTTKNEGNISGGFFIAVGTLSGTSEQKDVYKFYERIEKDTYRLVTVDAAPVAIHESTNEVPHAIYSCTYEKIRADFIRALTGTEFCIPSVSALVVPPGSITRNINLDAL